MSNSRVEASTESAPKLLECTLRDGSYAVDFQFSREDTLLLASRLDALGFPLIEVGHGIGIGASRAITPAAATDEQYAKAASESVKNGLWGMFAIAGVATTNEIKALHGEGMGFVRIGVDPSGLVDAGKLIDHARNLGLEVYVNFMKSYSVTPREMGELTARAEEWGVHGVYLVDSAGGMLPHDVESYALAMIESRQSALLGFHGHDNLGLGVANSLRVASLGFDLVDCTMQGLGRSAGNASTERLVALLSRLGSNSFDVSDVARTSEELVRPRIPKAGFSGLDTYAGYCLFHSSYLSTLLDVSRTTRVDPYVLMQEHCIIDQTNASKDDLLALAEQLTIGDVEVRLPLDKYVGGDQ